MSNGTISRIDDLERLEAMGTLASLARDLARDLLAFIAGAHQVVMRGHHGQCRTELHAYGRADSPDCNCGFDELREALKGIEP